MSDEKKINEDAPTASSMAAFSDKLTDLGEALSILYITRNASGRHRFREKWPEVSEYLFGLTLINYDIGGVEDKELRVKLEEEANNRRIDLKQIISEIVDKSVKSGSLLFDYVGEVIDQYGVDMSVFLYAEDVIERVRPGLLATRGETPQENIKESNDKKEEPASGDDLTAIATISEVSEDLKVDKSDDMSETGTITNEGDNKKDEQTPASDEKLSNEEKSLLSNNPETPEKVKPIETPSPQTEGTVTPQEPKILKSEMDGIPDVLKPPVKEGASTDKTPDAPTKVEELTLQQAAKADKGVYMAMFNALAGLS